MSQLSASRSDQLVPPFECGEDGALPPGPGLAHAHAPGGPAPTADDWEALFDALPDAVAIIDCEHRFVRINRRMAARLEVDVEAAVGQPCYELVHGTSEPPAFCPYRRALEDREAHAARIYEPVLRGFFDVLAVPLLDRAGRMTGCVHVLRDISGERRAEDRPGASEAGM